MIFVSMKKGNKYLAERIVVSKPKHRLIMTRLEFVEVQSSSDSQSLCLSTRQREAGERSKSRDLQLTCWVLCDL